MIECSIIKPIHVVKKETDSFALVVLQRQTLCNQELFPQQEFWVVAHQITLTIPIAGHLPRTQTTSAVPLALSTTAANTNSNPASITSPNNSNLNAPASDIINANAIGLTDDDWCDDI
ncbi:hypothetical protein G6F43_006299 [Rhizopus delemar]|nr:hypothetical protein G6F43_006299 [Rhizopus delemar]